MKISEPTSSKEIIAGNSSINLVTSEQQFVPDYEMFEWTSGDLRTCITIISEMPSGLRMDSMYWGVIDDGNAFEIIINRAKELTDSKLTFKKWLSTETNDSNMQENHPKFIAYTQLLESRKVSPIDVGMKKARFELPQAVESTASVNIVRYKDEESRSMNTVLFFIDLIVADEAFKHVKPELHMEDV